MDVKAHCAFTSIKYDYVELENFVCLVGEYL